MTLTRDIGSKLANKKLLPISEHQERTNEWLLHFTQTRMPQSQAWQEQSRGQEGAVYPPLVEMEKATTSLGEFGSSCVTAAESNTFPFCWQGVENRSTQKTCTQMLRAALFIIVKLTPPWRQIGITQGQVWIGYPGIGKSLSPAQYCYKCKSATIRSLCLLKGRSRQQWFHFGLQTSQRFTKRLPHTLELFHCTEGTSLPHCEITVLRIRFSCWLSSLWASPQHSLLNTVSCFKQFGKILHINAASWGKLRPAATALPSSHQSGKAAWLAGGYIRFLIVCSVTLIFFFFFSP